MRYVAVVFLCGLLSSPAFAGESYICLTDLAVGFAFNKDRKEWERGSFKANSKYVISKSTQKEYRWEVKNVGEKLPVAGCKTDFNEVGTLVCEGFIDFRINKKNLRFLSTYALGYWTYSPGNTLFGNEGENTPYMEIGKCSPM